jgi:hypothetical protein
MRGKRRRADADRVSGTERSRAGETPHCRQYERFPRHLRLARATQNCSPRAESA